MRLSFDSRACLPKKQHICYVQKDSRSVQPKDRDKKKKCENLHLSQSTKADHKLLCHLFNSQAVDLCVLTKSPWLTRIKE